MTVNGLMAELRKLQRAGRGNNKVFQRTPGEQFCMPVESVSAYHTTAIGHVVIRGADPALMVD